MKKRLKFKCWHCKKKYTLHRTITEQQTLLVCCPYCGQEGVVDIAPYRKKVKSIFKGEGDQELGEEYQFPEELPTREPE